MTTTPFIELRRSYNIGTGLAAQVDDAVCSALTKKYEYRNILTSSPSTQEDVMIQPLRPEDPEYIAECLLEGRLGEGAMGLVYKGWNAAGTPVAIKVIAGRYVEDPKYRERFQREAAAALRIPRFCTAQVLAASSTENPPYIITEFIPGPTLTELVPQELLHGAQVEAIAVAISAALQAIHEAGVIHRDLKPSNILISPYGPRVIDFGLASLIEGRERLTSSGNAVGTIAYMAPEQASGADVTTSADIYSWGATVVFSATGSPPRRGDAARPGLSKVDKDALGLPSELCEIVSDSLASNPLDRPAASEILSRLIGLSPSVIATAASIDSKPPRRPSPRDANQWAVKANESLIAGRPRLALHEAELGIGIDPSHARCWFQKGRAQIQLGQRDAGEDSVRLAYEMDPSDATIAAGYAEALVESPNVDSKALAFRISPPSEQKKDLYIRKLMSLGREGVIQAYSIDSSHPQVVDAYGQIMMAEIVGSERESREAEEASGKFQAEAYEARFIGRNSEQAVRNATERAEEADELAKRSVEKARELAVRAYLAVPDSRPIRLKYAEILLDGRGKDVALAYRLGRDSDAFIAKFVGRALLSLPPSQLHVVILELDEANTAEIRALATAFLREIRKAPTTVLDAQKAAYRAVGIERVATYCSARLTGDDNDGEGLRAELDKTIEDAFSAEDDDGLVRSVGSVLLAIVIALVTYSLIVLIGAPLPYRSVIVNGSIIASIVIYVLCVAAFGERATRHRRRRELTDIASIESDQGEDLSHSGGQLDQLTIKRTKIDRIDGFSNDPHSAPKVIDSSGANSE